VAELQAVYDALKDERIRQEENLDVKRQELEVALANLAAESQAGSDPSLEVQSSLEMAQQAIKVAETAVSEIMSREEEAGKAFEYASASAGEAPAASASQSADAKTSNATLIAAVAAVVVVAISVGMVATLVRMRARKNRIPELTKAESFENPVYQSQTIAPTTANKMEDGNAGYLEVDSFRLDNSDC